MAAKEYYHYDPSAAAATAFAFLFLLTTSLHLYQMLRTKTLYFTSFVVGGIFEVFGFAARTVNAHQTPDWTFAPFVVQSMGILLAPAFFAASIYMAFGRIAELVQGQSLLFVRLRWVTRLFVCGDVVSFIFQAAGGAILARQDANTANLGKAVVEVGLCAQIVSFSFFLANVTVFWIRLRRRPATACSGDLPWRKHLITLLVAGGIILIRCVYRVVEYTQGAKGEIQTHEVFTYALDAALMLLVMLIFHALHPSEIRAFLKGGRVAVFFRVHTVARFDPGLPLME